MLAFSVLHGSVPICSDDTASMKRAENKSAASRRPQEDNIDNLPQIFNSQRLAMKTLNEYLSISAVLLVSLFTLL